tara:strand:- start:186 stop:923 length:738 start_codon:yes stop_codon:yes gene_type:complete
MKNNIAIIPARMASTRFPGKPLALINGKPMVGHVYDNVRKCNMLKETFVATCDQEIADYIESINGKYIMTSDKHQRASDRTAEAMLKAEQLLKTKLDIIVMVQGDEPMVTSPMIEKSLLPFKDKNINIVNLMTKINSIEEFEDPNEPKVVVDLNSNAIYFSREPIPSRKKGVKNVPMFKQVCVIPFRRDYLIEYNTLPEANLERIESIDMNRIIENGDKIRMVEIAGPVKSVDTTADLNLVSQLM